MEVAALILLILAAGSILIYGLVKIVGRLAPLPGPAPPDLRPLLASLHDELSTVRRDLADVATAIAITTDARESSLLKQINDLHDRLMVVMSPAFLREFRRQPVTSEERAAFLGRRQQDIREERAARRIHYPGFEPDLRPRVRPGGIDSVVEDDASVRRGVMAESFDDLPEDRSADVSPDASTPEGALAAAQRNRR